MRKILLPLTILVICILGIYIYCNSKLEHPRYTVKNKDKLEVGTPIIVNKDKIKTYSCIYDSKYKYSQIKIKNISDEPIYDISISLKLKEPQVQEPAFSSYSEPMYFFRTLNPGESANLTAKHENEDAILDVYGYSYSTGDNLVYEATKSQDSVKVGISSYNDIYKSGQDYKKKPLTSKEDKIVITDIRKNIKGDKINLEYDVKNISNETLKNIYFYFNEIHNGEIVGTNNQGSIAYLNPNQNYTIKLSANKDVKLKFSNYDYYIEKKKDNKIIGREYFEIYKSQNRFTLYEDNELNYKNTNHIFFIIIAVFTFVFGIINSRIKTIKKGLKNNEENLNIKNTIKKLNILKFILIAIYLIIGVYFLFIINS